LSKWISDQQKIVGTFLFLELLLLMLGGFVV